MLHSCQCCTSEPGCRVNESRVLCFCLTSHQLTQTALLPHIRSYGLVNEGNIRMLTRELLDYLAVSDADFKPDLTSKICTLIQRFAPDRRWQIDSLLQVMVQAGQHVKEEVGLCACMCACVLCIVCVCLCV